MSARPGKWELLGYDSDPVTGDSYQVGVEGRHYTGVANTISDQIGRLKLLAEPDDRLKGSYAPELTGACSDLADHLGQIEGRFRTTGSQLSGFEDDVSTARTATGNALDDAETAVKGKELSELWPNKLGAPEDGPLKDAWSAGRGAVSTFNDRAGEVADKIRGAADDDMKDSFWDKFKDFVHSVAGVLDAIADILGYIAAALVIVSLFIPGLNLITLAVIVGVAALAIHTLLAATGNGSWLDVALDVFALATMGAGGALGGLAKGAGKVALRGAAKTAANKAATSVLKKASFNGGKGLLGKLSMGKQFFTTSTSKAMDTAARNAVRNVLKAKPLGLGDDALANSTQLLRNMRAMNLSTGFKFPALTYSATAAGKASDIVTVGSKILDPDIGPIDVYTIEPYNDLSESLNSEGLGITIGGPY